MTQLPPDWRERAVVLPKSHPQAREKVRWFLETGRTVWAEDDCSLQSGLVVVEKDTKTGKITVFVVQDHEQAVIMPRSWN